MVDCIAKLAPFGRSVPAGRLHGQRQNTEAVWRDDSQDPLGQSVLSRSANAYSTVTQTHIGSESLYLGPVSQVVVDVGS